MEEAMFSRELTDSQYLDASEIGLLVSAMLDQVTVQKPDDGIEFCRLYLQRVNSMQHVIGADFSYILSCGHNRRSFVHCCLDLYKNVGPSTEFTVLDLHKLYCFICPDLSVAVVQEAVLYIDPVSADPCRYSYGDIQFAFFFQILFYEWLKVVSPVFQTEDVKRFVSIRAENILTLIHEKTKNETGLFFHLPMTIVKEVIEDLVDRAKGGEVTFELLNRSMLQSPGIKYFILSRKK